MLHQIVGRLGKVETGCAGCAVPLLLVLVVMVLIIALYWEAVQGWFGGREASAE